MGGLRYESLLACPTGGGDGRLEGLFGMAWHRTPALNERPFKQLRTVFFMRSHVGNWQLALSNSRVDLEVLEASKKGTDS